MMRPDLRKHRCINFRLPTAGTICKWEFEHQISSLLNAGALMQVLDDWCVSFPGVFLYYPGRRQASPALAAFIAAFRVPSRSRRAR